MTIEQGLYAQVFNPRRKYFKSIAANKNKNEAKFKFHGQYARSRRCFYLDFYWIEVNFSTCEPEFYKKSFQSHDDTQHRNKFKIFPVLIGNSKCVENFKFHNDAPMLKYFQDSLNRCCFGSLASSFSSIK